MGKRGNTECHSDRGKKKSESESPAPGHGKNLLVGRLMTPMAINKRAHRVCQKRARNARRS
jgi:hypothetical protein